MTKGVKYISVANFVKKQKSFRELNEGFVANIFVDLWLEEAMIKSSSYLSFCSALTSAKISSVL
jgi:hypothetical protein